MSWCWLARCAERPPGALASCKLSAPGGASAGVLAAWDSHAEPPTAAVKVDGRSIDPNGSEAWISLVWAPNAGGLPFDDPAVSGAIRATLLLPPVDLLSTLTLGDAEFIGAVTGMHGGDADRLNNDPFACIFPRQLLLAGAGLWGQTPPPVGPGTQRYGADNPWPWDRF